MRERLGGHPAWMTCLAAGAAGAVLVLSASPVYAQDEDESGGEKLCDLHDPRLGEASGIATAGDDGWWIVPDGDNQDFGMDILRVGADCNVRDSESLYIDHQPIDPEALAVDVDGFLWAADIGTEGSDRSTISVTQVEPTDVSNRVMFRFVYPDGMRDAEAFLLLPDGKTPLFIPAVEGQAPLYMPTTEKQAEDTPMQLAGTADLAEGGTVTGADLNADASKVVVRTGTHAYEWEVKDGDVISAMTETEPLITPIEGEPAGQDISYDSEGNFITLTQTGGDDGTFASISRYTPTEPPPPEPVDDGGDQAAAEDDGGIVDFLLDLGFENIVRILAGIAVVGFLVMLAGILVIRKHRREHAEDEDENSSAGFAAEESVFGDLKDDPPPEDPVDLGLDAGQPDPEVGKLAQSAAGGSVYGTPKTEPAGNVYGGSGPESAGSVYGAPKAEPQSAGAVYGGAREEPKYGAFESAGHGSIYNDAGESFAVEPPPPPPPPAPAPPAGNTYGAPREPAGSVYGGAESGGTVYGAGNNERTPEPDDDYWGPPEDQGRGR